MLDKYRHGDTKYYVIFMALFGKPKGSLEEVTETAVEKGGILATLYFDAHGNTPDEVEGLLVNMGQKLAQEEGVIYAVSEIERALEMEDKLFSTASKVKVLVDSFKSLTKICGLYGPMGVEILKPDEIRLSPGEAHEVLFMIAEMSHEFTTTMMMKLMKPEERAALGEKLKHRAEMGKKLMEEIEKENKK
jgi:hypothetical protein